MKFHLSMTLFAIAASEPASPYREALDRWWGAEADPETVRLLGLRDADPAASGATGP